MEVQATGASELIRVRTYLHGLINEAENVAVLEAIATLLATSLLPAQPALPEFQVVKPEEISPAERAAVEEGFRQSEAGLGRPHAEVWAEYEAKYGVKCDL